MSEGLDRLRAEMAKQGAQALVALSPENVAYTIGSMVPSHPTNRHRRTISILAADGRSALVVVSVEAELARQQSRLEDVRHYDQFTQNPMDMLADVLREFGAAAGPVAIEPDYLPAQDYLTLRERLPALAAIITNAVLEAGGDGVRMLIGSGECSAIVNPRPGDRALRRGDVIRVEILAHLDNYQSNVTGTGVPGRVTHEQRRIWDVLMEARGPAPGCSATARISSPRSSGPSWPASSSPSSWAWAARRSGRRP